MRIFSDNFEVVVLHKFCNFGLTENLSKFDCKKLGKLGNLTFLTLAESAKTCLSQNWETCQGKVGKVVLVQISDGS